MSSSSNTINIRGLKHLDIVFAVAVLAMVIMMIVPIPTQLLDILLTVNISVAVVILLVALYNKDALEFSSFPSLLLITTLFRLSLNVSSTRLILLQGFAGEIIQTFGQFVLGGSAVVGFVIFIILIIIQFIVITRGAERVSEVAARFTLDAMPGKQMAIDADLNTGLISEEEAKERRKKIQREADFYGAMDGASKFVKGDAIAGIIIVVINIVGGFIIGVLQKGMSVTQALNTYTILTVGDGLVSQIPALLISTATGIIVTRAASDTDLGHEVGWQVFRQPKVLAIATGALVLLAILGMPAIPFIALAAVMGVISYSIHRTQQQTAQLQSEKQQEEEIENIKKPENVLGLLHVDTLELELGYSLIPLVDAQQGGDLLDRVVMIRRQCALELGIVLPPIRMRDNMQLKPNCYSIKIKGVEVASGELIMDRYLAMSSGLTENGITGIDTVEPAFGLPAKWIPANLREQAELAGYTVVDPSSVVATHLTEVIKSHAHEILSRQDVQTLLDNIKSNYPAVVEELVPQVLSLGEVQKVLANLLRERVAIRDLVTILETLADYGKVTKDPEMLTEYVRQALSRQIIKQYLDGNEKLHVITLDPAVEQLIRDSIQHTDHGSFVAIDPVKGQALFEKLSNVITQVTEKGYMPIILCAPVVRIYFKRLTEKLMPKLVVLSYNELDNRINVESVGVVNI
ncbi:flagellar biosynthesis protein FlhA [Thermincola potens]|uniref:Flagellar biosynthesis protein FlhA n=1 Tax=Thermincola potens (strain JR) TaxID=635013 RepID=D5XFF4_THEPJ|nr:flagellar biosynthesis protein FlhA [Thermincola potens]ADG82375.1 flagellar biosynthesis protein FlhA [Thermincola potens JR]